MSELETLIEAVKAGDVARVQGIVTANPALSSARLVGGDSPLMTALYRGHREVMRVLLDAGAELDVFAAAATGEVEALRSQIRDTSNISRHAYDGWTPLHLAAFFGHIDTARVLLDAGADVNAVSQNSLANTPLHAATAGKHSDVALLLLANGANPVAVDAGGYTPIQIARQNELSEVVRAIGA
jgi:ankyrin repeat protein